ncbi:glycosyltransferase family 87 protein [Smaragdicoccus niigatensis]|uniref:glycosyltransferase family 87 protein n=1 Tax=Smaragdicoccus niigatensis TaxID=359359 RepID=UPI00036F95D6|nr:glycosyltransferase family 87 protein [Smaragdicoccus niigatensis]
MFLNRLEPKTARTNAELVRYVMWPLAIFTFFHRVLVLAVNGHITDDFRPVYQAALNFANHRPVYTSDLSSVDPHYLYPPSGTLLMTPLAYVDPTTSRYLFIVANALAILMAWYLLLRLFNRSVSSVAAPVLLFGMFFSETVTNTLVFTNVNGIVLLGEVIFLLLMLNKREWSAGLAIGLTLAIKPILAPLLLIALARRQWKILPGAIAVPAVTNAIAWPLAVDPMAFITKTMPYLSTPRDYFNSAIVGNGAYFGVAPWLLLVMRTVFIVMVVVTLWLLYRYHREDELFFVTTATGVLLTASFLLGSLGQMYYSMMLFPLIVSVMLPNSVMRNWPAWVAVYGFMSFDQWLSWKYQWLGRDVEYLRSTLGWSLLLIVVFAVLVDRYWNSRRKPDVIVPSETREPVLVAAG